MSVDFGFMGNALLFFLIGLFVKLLIFNLPDADNLNFADQRSLKANLKTFMTFHFEHIACFIIFFL